MWTRVDSNRFIAILLETIASYKKDYFAVEMANKYVISSNGRKILQMTTQGWKLKVLCIDCVETWTPLQDLK